MKYLEHTLELYVYNHYNMCNIPIYFCNIDIQYLQIPLKLLKYLKYTLATYNFHPSSFRTMQHRAGKRSTLEICILAIILVTLARGVTST
jgi:hypothetical protein